MQYVGGEPDSKNINSHFIDNTGRHEEKTDWSSQCKLFSGDTFQSQFLFNLGKINKGKLCVCASLASHVQEGRKASAA